MRFDVPGIRGARARQLEAAIVQAVKVSPREAARRMRAMRKRVHDYDVTRWASTFLEALGVAPQRAGSG